MLRRLIEAEGDLGLGDHGVELGSFREPGELREAGAAASTGGRCAQRYARDPRFRVMLCARLEGRQLSYEVRDLDGAVLERTELPHEGTVLQMLDKMAAQVREAYPNQIGRASCRERV